MTKPLLIRPDGTIGPGGLTLIENYAAEGKTQRSIASALGMSLKHFEKALEKNKGDNPARLAWERGFADNEQRAVDAIRQEAFGNVGDVELVNDKGETIIDEETGKPKKAKARVMTQSKNGGLMAIWYTKTQLGWTEKPKGALVQDNRIQITLPAPMGFGEMMHALGQKEVADFRKDKAVPLKDVTPEWAQPALPAPAKPEGEDK